MLQIQLEFEPFSHFSFPGTSYSIIGTLYPCESLQNIKQCKLLSFISLISENNNCLLIRFFEYEHLENESRLLVSKSNIYYWEKSLWDYVLNKFVEIDFFTEKWSTILLKKNFLSFLGWFQKHSFQVPFIYSSCQLCQSKYIEYSRSIVKNLKKDFHIFYTK